MVDARYSVKRHTQYTSFARYSVPERCGSCGPSPPDARSRSEGPHDALFDFAARAVMQRGTLPLESSSPESRPNTGCVSRTATYVYITSNSPRPPNRLSCPAVAPNRVGPGANPVKSVRVMLGANPNNAVRSGQGANPNNSVRVGPGANPNNSGPELARRTSAHGGSINAV
eukprot:657897-Prorocentrum_minimum.AAC.1